MYGGVNMAAIWRYVKLFGRYGGSDGGPTTVTVVIVSHCYNPDPLLLKMIMP
jgi:hypothetical protein